MMRAESAVALGTEFADRMIDVTYEDMRSASRLRAARALSSVYKPTVNY